MSTYLEGYLIGVCLMGMLGELKSPNENASGKILLEYCGLYALWRSALAQSFK